jgi:hypothetical protein
MQFSMSPCYFLFLRFRYSQHFVLRHCSPLSVRSCFRTIQVTDCKRTHFNLRKNISLKGEEWQTCCC